MFAVNNFKGRPSKDCGELFDANNSQHDLDFCLNSGSLCPAMDEKGGDDYDDNEWGFAHISH